MIHDKLTIPPASQVDGATIAAVGLERIATEGVAAIEPVLSALHDAAIDADADIMQPVLAEALFQLLDALDGHLADPALYALILRLPPQSALRARDLLLLANFPDGPASHEAGLYALSDSAALLLVALAVAGGEHDQARHLLTRIDYGRSGPRLEQAVLQLRCALLASVDEVVEQMIFHVLDGLDHPELWACMPFIVARFPGLCEALARRNDEAAMLEGHIASLLAVALAADGRTAEALALIEPVALANSLRTLVQGAFFHVKARLDPENPAYRLTDRFCVTPFEQFDILDGTTHLCCVSWMQTSAGNLSAAGDWSAVWNSPKAQKIRASILDGSYRYCNKTACPQLAAGTLPTRAEVAARSDVWRDIVENERTALDQGPALVNLAYDASCNLSCPSCRTRVYAVNAATRGRYETLQDEMILPMLKSTRLVFISGNGDPFASKNFRSLIERLGPEDYPDLRFQLMTNGMLLTPTEWARLPALHGRVASLRISLDAATGPTHELLRRGARWPVMEENLAFARQLRTQGLVDQLCFAFTVQADNYREMGAFVDLGHRFGADVVTFMRLTNWGTFSQADYAGKAVFAASHPDHMDFLREMQDPRLRDPIAALMDLSGFVESGRPQ